MTRSPVPVLVVLCAAALSCSNRPPRLPPDPPQAQPGRPAADEQQAGSSRAASTRAAAILRELLPKGQVPPRVVRAPIPRARYRRAGFDGRGRLCRRLRVHEARSPFYARGLTALGLGERARTLASVLPRLRAAICAAGDGSAPASRAAPPGTPARGPRDEPAIAFDDTAIAPLLEAMRRDCGLAEADEWRDLEPRRFDEWLSAERDRSDAGDVPSASAGGGPAVTPTTQRPMAAFLRCVREVKDSADDCGPGGVHAAAGGDDAAASATRTDRSVTVATDSDGNVISTTTTTTTTTTTDAGTVTTTDIVTTDADGNITFHEYESVTTSDGSDVIDVAGGSVQYSDDGDIEAYNTYAYTTDGDDVSGVSAVAVCDDSGCTETTLGDDAGESFLDGMSAQQAGRAVQAGSTSLSELLASVPGKLTAGFVWRIGVGLDGLDLYIGFSGSWTGSSKRCAGRPVALSARSSLLLPTSGGMDDGGRSGLMECACRHVFAGSSGCERTPAEVARACDREPLGPTGAPRPECLALQLGRARVLHGAQCPHALCPSGHVFANAVGASGGAGCVCANEETLGGMRPGQCQADLCPDDSVCDNGVCRPMDDYACSPGPPDPLLVSLGIAECPTPGPAR